MVHIHDANIYFFARLPDRLIKGCWKFRMSNRQGNGGVINKLNKIWFPDAYFMTSGNFTLSHIFQLKQYPFSL